jgi:hypothetical protein
LEINISKALAKSQQFMVGKRELELCKKEFTNEHTKMFQFSAEREMNYCKEKGIKNLE